MFEKNVADYLDIPKKVKGDLGVEVEMGLEEEFNPTHINQKVWGLDYEEGSIKGYGIELVLKKPAVKTKIPKLISDLKEGLMLGGVEIRPTIQAGVHIHVNMQDKTIGDVFKLMMSYYPLETALTNFCGSGRQGNLFCLRAKDAMYISQNLYDAVGSEDIYHLRSDDFRYSALNIQSLFKYGSVEFRALATIPDLSNIEPWCLLIDRIKTYSESITSCWEILAKVSGMGVRAWLVEVLGEDLLKLIDYEGIEKDVTKDMRNMQMVYMQLTEHGV